MGQIISKYYVKYRRQMKRLRCRFEGTFVLAVVVACETTAVVRMGALQRPQPLLDCGKTADSIEMPFGVVGRWTQTTMYWCLTLDPDPRAGKGNFCGNATYRENALRQRFSFQIHTQTHTPD